MSLIGLNHLLKASSRAIAEKSISLVFISRNDPPKICQNSLKSFLDLESMSQAEELYDAILECVETTLMTGTIESLAQLFEEKAADVSPQLKKLVGQIINSKLEEWKEAAAFNRVSLPKLVDMDWSVTFKKASSEVHHMHIPAVTLQLGVQGETQRAEEMAAVRRLDVELTREALDTMLDGMRRIRDQLASMG